MAAGDVRQRQRLEVMRAAVADVERSARLQQYEATDEATIRRAMTIVRHAVGARRELDDWLADLARAMRPLTVSGS